MDFSCEGLDPCYCRAYGYIYESMDIHIGSHLVLDTSSILGGAGPSNPCTVSLCENITFSLKSSVAPPPSSVVMNN